MNETRPGGLDIVSVPVHVNAGAQRITAAFIAQSSGVIDDLVSPYQYTLADSIGSPRLTQLPHIQDFNISGPFKVTGVSENSSRQRVFSCRPLSAFEQLSCARQIITDLASQAYRRTVSEADILGLLSTRLGRRGG